MRRTISVGGVVALILGVAILVKGSITQVPSGTWAAAGDLLEARTGASAALLSDGRVLVTGGEGINGPVVSAELFNSAGSFSAAAPMNVARSQHSSITLNDGRVLVAGGHTSGAGVTNAAEVFNPATDSWTVAGSMTEGRAGHTASLLKDGRVLIAGGETSGSASPTLEIFDPQTGSFIFAGTMSSPRKDHAAAVLGDERVLIAGGSNGSVALASTDLFDAQSGAVSAGPSLFTPRFGLSATTLLDGKVLLVGGSNGAADLVSAEIFSPATGSVSVVTTPLATPRSNHQAFLLANNNSVLIVGGTSSTISLATAELFQPWNGQFHPTGAMSTSRAGTAGSTLSLDGLLLLTGGSDGSNRLASSELYGFATVKTDRDDYAPDETVTITGSGWQPGETVTLLLHEANNPEPHEDEVLTTIADSAGRIFNDEFAPDHHDIGIRFYLTASGSQSQAQTTFTDAPKVGSVAVGSQTGNLTVGTAGTATFTITVNRGSGGGSSGAFTANLSVTTPLPTGATASFTPNPVSFSPSQNSRTATLTINSTNATPAGETSFTVKAATSANDFATNTGTLTVAKADQTITWSNPAGIVYGTALGAAQLNATVTVPGPSPAGSLTYTPGAGTILNAGTGQTLTVTAAATSNYKEATKSVTIDVAKADQTIAWANPAGIVYGTALGAAQLNATVAVPGPSPAGSLTYTPGAGTILNAGPVQTLTVTAAATNNYNEATKSVKIDVTKAEQTISWSNPPDIVYGTPLGAGQLNATVSVVGPAPAGNLSYSPVAGTLLNAGSGQMLTLNLEATNNYNAANKSVLINVLKATPVITWANPADIVYGTPLSGTQLNATASASGSFVYTPAAGTLLNAGAGQALTVDFTANDTNNYNDGSKTVQINVLRATPVITWNNPADIVYGTALSATQLNAAASFNGSPLAGTFTYTPSAGTILNAGSNQILSANFVPDSTNNFNNASASISLNVLKANQIITWSDPAGIIYGTPLSATQLNATVNVPGPDAPGALTYTPGLGEILNAGSHTLSVTAAETANYNPATKSVTIEVAKANQTITWTSPAGIVYGTPLSAVQLNATVSVVGPALAGVLTYTPAAGTILDAGNGQTLGVTAAETENYNPATAAVTINVAKADQTVQWSNPADIVYGTPLGAAQLNATVTVPGPSAHGALTYTPGSGTILDAGDNQSLTVNAAETNNYNPATKTVAINVAKATPVFSNLMVLTIPAGKSPTVLSGKVNSNTVIPTGSVSITLAGVTQSAAIQPSGDFSSSFNTSTLLDLQTYPITYSYAETNNFKAAIGSGSLTAINVIPVVSTNSSAVTVNEGTSAANSGTWSDENPFDNLVFTASAGSVTKSGNNSNGTWNWSYQTTDGPAQSQTITITANDGHGGVKSVTFELTVNNVPPTATFNAPTAVNEGTPITLSLTGVVDSSPVDAPFNFAFDCGTGAGYGPFSGSNTASCATNENGSRIVKGMVMDKDGGAREYIATVAINNVAPLIGSVAGPVGPLPISAATATVTANFTDPGSVDTHSCTFAWDEPNTQSTASGTGDGSCTSTHTYAAAGVYAVEVTVADDDGGTATTKYEYVVIYDPNGGFVTGGGWINSPAGAYTANPSLTGKAHFGFVSKYQKGASKPTGETEFQFQVVNFNFHSTSYDWLVVAGSKAQYKGTGTINRTGEYGFLLTATDGNVSGGGGADKFRIKIWNKANGAIVYDNALAASDDIDAANPQAIGGGSIVVHK